MSVRRCQAEVDSHEFTGWMAYWSLEPFGPEREDFRAGMVAATIANVNRDHDKKPEPFSPHDFFPPTNPGTAQTESPEDAQAKLEAKIMAWATAVNIQNSDEPPRSELRPKR